MSSSRGAGIKPQTVTYVGGAMRPLVPMLATAAPVLVTVKGQIQNQTSDNN